MSFDNTKYHCELNSVPYQIRGYQKTELATFIPRLSAGEQQEYDFDLLRSESISGFEAGSLQRYWAESSAFAIEGLENKYQDGTLYPVNGLETEVGRFTGSSYDDKTRVVAYARSKDYLFVGVVDTDTMTYNSSKIYRVDKSGTVTTITTSFESTGGNGTITDMVVYNDQLWVTTTYSSALYYMALSATTMNSITGGSGFFTKMVVFKGSLYGTSGQYANKLLYRYTGDTTTRSVVQVGDIGKQASDSTAELLVYNNRIFLTRADGIYAYDGVQMITIEDQTSNESTENYRFPCVMRGYLYYFMPDGMYRFNGTLIEKLYDRSEIGFPQGMEYGGQKLWITYNNTDTLGSSRYDKSMGYDYTSTTNMSGSLLFFDGKGLFTYGRVPVRSYNVSKGGTSQGIIEIPMYFNGRVFVSTYLSYDEETYETVATPPSTAPWLIASSIYDGGFPMISKNLENIEIVLDGVIGADETITIEYRTGGFAASSGWTTLGTIKTQTELKRYIWKTLPAGVTFDQIQLRFTGTTSLTYGIARIIMRFTLVPEYKNQWSFTALCYGDDTVSPLLLADDTESSQAVQTLRGNIYSARNSTIPVKFIDIDCLDLNEALDNSETTVTLNSTALLKGSEGFIQIDDEIMHYSAKTATDLTVLRGQLGTAAATHNDNSKVFPVYRVVVRQITNERIELDRPENTSEDKSRNSEITLVLQEV